MSRLGSKALSRFSSLLGIGLTASLFGFGFANNFHAEGKIEQQPNKDGKFRVAIIGSGIGGSSAAYFIHKSLNASVEIDVFEKAEKVGGRMAVIEIDKNQYESGGSVIHDSNKYMVEFCKMLGELYCLFKS